MPETRRCEICDRTLGGFATTYCAACQKQRDRDIEGKSHCLVVWEIAGRLRRLARLVEHLGSQWVRKSTGVVQIDSSLELLENDFGDIECELCGASAFIRMREGHGADDFQSCPGCEGFHCGACMATVEQAVANGAKGIDTATVCPADAAVREAIN